MRLPRVRFGYANVVSTLALFVALGGVSWAAVTLPKNSVGTSQLRDGAVTGSKVKRGAIGIKQVDLASLRPELSGVPGPPGDMGPEGPPGAKGDTGAQGPPGVSGIFKGAATASGPSGNGLTFSTGCGSSQVVLSAGWKKVSGTFTVESFYPSETNSNLWYWTVNASTSWTLTLYLVCANAS